MIGWIKCFLGYHKLAIHYRRVNGINNGLFIHEDTGYAYCERCRALYKVKENNKGNNA